MILSQALKERDEAQRKVQELIAQHVAEVEDLKSQLAKVPEFTVTTFSCRSEQISRKPDTTIFTGTPGERCSTAQGAGNGA